MESMYLMTNQVKNYAWGHTRHIPDFLGISNVQNTPVAELWMGAHPLVSSLLEICPSGEESVTTNLSDFISTDRKNVLGPEITREFGHLPYLFKLLAAGKALSIQAHPSKTMAETGFRKEEDAGIPRNATERNYRDNNHKPEIIVAMTPFTALMGFRDPEEILTVFTALKPTRTLGKMLGQLEKKIEHGASEALALFFKELLTLDHDSKKDVLISACDASRSEADGLNQLQCHWVSQLIESFPDDIGALAPLFLHVVELEPGEALFLPSRILHAYLGGVGLELMANSDNVLRGGLTQKHIDVAELMNVLDCKVSIPEKLIPNAPDARGIRSYSIPAREFSLGVSDFESGKSVDIYPGSGPVIALIMEGEIQFSDGSNEWKLSRGQSVFIPWKAELVRLTGRGQVAFAGAGI